jgi:DNA-binding MarR family transcriptional regulator
MGELAAALWVDASTATRAVAPLVARGLVERTRDPADGRCVRVALTAYGRAFQEDVAARRTEVWNTMLEGFTPEELEVFAGSMERLVEALDAVASARV